VALQQQVPGGHERPPGPTVRAFGVEYTHVRPPEGGDLFVTHFGWPDLDALMPARWYADQWYANHGEKLAGATGQVYRSFLYLLEEATR